MNRKDLKTILDVLGIDDIEKYFKGQSLQSILAEEHENYNYLGDLADIVDPEWGGRDDYEDPEQRFLFENLEMKPKIKEEQFFTPEEYQSLFLDRKLNSMVGYHGLKDELAESPHNTPENNDKIFNKLLKLSQKEKKRNQYDVDEDDLNQFLKNYKVGDKLINQVLNDDKYKIPNDYYKGRLDLLTGIFNNPNLKKEHLYRFANQNPDKSDYVVNHDLFDDRLEDIIFGNENNIKQLPSTIVNKLLNKKRLQKENGDVIFDLNNKRLLDILNYKDDEIMGWHLPHILDQLEEDSRKDYIDRRIGLKDSKYRAFDTPENYDLSNPEEKAQWDRINWGQKQHGPDYKSKVSKILAGTKYLDNDQIEYIKRNGDFEDKYQLYHNKHVDPKHGVEMFRKWSNDESDDGYDAEELIEKYKEDKDDIYTLDDLPEGTINEDDLWEGTYEYAEERYPFSEYIDDNLEEFAKELDIDDSHIDDIYDKLNEEYDDWEGDNPNFVENVDGPNNENIEKLIEVAENDPEGDGDIYRRHIEQVPEVKKDWDMLFPDIAIPEDDDELVDINDVRNTIVPDTIDFANNDDYTINDHPDFDERFNEISLEYKKDLLRERPYDFSDYFYESYRESEPYMEVEREAMEENREYAAKEHYQELYKTSHQDDRFIPNHLTEHIPELQEIAKERKKLSGEGPARSWLKELMPQKSYEIQYGENQHHYEMLKDYADANKGSIDMGRMVRLFPNLKDTWKKIFDGKGKLSSEDIQGKIDSIPKTQYDISYGRWDKGKMQNLNDRDQVIIRLDHSNSSLAPLKEDEGLFNTFEKVQETSRRSGHPTLKNTIAWARIDMSDPNHWMIDELQSDFGKQVVRYLKENNAEEKANHVKKIADYHKNWREMLINHIIKEAKKHGVEKISTHSPESKSSHTGSGKIHTVYKEGYQKIPRRMGFKQSDAEKLPLTDETRDRVFNKIGKTSLDDIRLNHETGAEKHYKYEVLFNRLLENEYGRDTMSDITDDQIKNSIAYHNKMYNEHRNRLEMYGGDVTRINHWDVEDEHDKNDINDAIESIKKQTPIKLERDKSLEQPPIDPNKPDYFKGHTYEIKPQLQLPVPKLKKSYFGIKLNLFKALPDFQQPKEMDYDLEWVDPSQPHIVHSGEHGFRGEMGNLPAQKELIHGLDMTSGEPIGGGMGEGTKIHTNPVYGSRSIVKPASGIAAATPSGGKVVGFPLQREIGHEDIRGHNSARREVMYHNMANKFFNLGQYVPTTAGFTKKGEDYSAQKYIDGHSLKLSDYKNGQWSPKVKKNYIDFLKNASKSGDLHKLAMMDVIMGNNDRNRGNYLLGKDDNQIHLIDNGIAFHYDPKVKMGVVPVPAFLKDAESFKLSDKIHPEALQWLNNLSDEKALDIWDNHGYGIDHPSVQGFLTRLHNLKAHVNKEKDNYSTYDLLNDAQSFKDKITPESEEETQRNYPPPIDKISKSIINKIKINLKKNGRYRLKLNTLNKK